MQYPFKKFVLGTKYGVKGRSWKCGYHSGLDLKSRNYGGDGKVYPLYSGKVQKVSTVGSYGKCVYISHADGYITLYAHLSQILVNKGQTVNEKTCLGIEGSTGNSTGLHLHIEVHKGAYKYPATIDPLKFIEEGGEEMKVSSVSFILPNKKKISLEGFMVNDTNYTGARALLEALGYVVGWDGKNVIIKEGER